MTYLLVAALCFAVGYFLGFFDGADTARRIRRRLDAVMLDGSQQ